MNEMNPNIEIKNIKKLLLEDVLLISLFNNIQYFSFFCAISNKTILNYAT